MSARSGYSIVIRAFVAVDPANLADHSATIADIHEAMRVAPEGGKSEGAATADKMFRRMEVEQFDVRWSREPAMATADDCDDDDERPF